MHRRATAILVLSFALLVVLIFFIRHRAGSSSGDGSESVHPAPQIETRRLGDYSWIVSRVDRDAYFKDLAGVTKQITLKPNPGKEADSVTDLSILKVAEESPMYAAGFQDWGEAV
jgi:hypothetical protein